MACAKYTFLLILSVTVALTGAGSFRPAAMATEPPDAPDAVERRIRAAYELVAPAIVVIRGGDRGTMLQSGVIVSAAGHVEMERVGELHPGEMSLVMGYPWTEGSPVRDRQPYLKLGCIAKSAAPVWFTSTHRSRGGDQGGGVFDLEGRLLGITVGISPWQDALHSRAELLRMHWDELAVEDDSAESPPVGKRHADESVNTPNSAGKKSKHTLAAAAQARAATVRLRRISEEPQHGWSGVVVSSDGYVVTCAHHEGLPDEKVIVSFCDGRESAGRVLSSNRLCDIGLVNLDSSRLWRSSL